MRKILLFISSIMLLALGSCQESLEEKAERDAKEYTRKYCPTPELNNTRTDSVAFDKARRVYTYYITFTGVMDDQELIDNHKDEICEMLNSGVHESTSMKQYIEAGIKFEYICRSVSNPKKILLRVKV